MLIDHLPPITTDRFWDLPLKVLLATMLLSLIAPIEIPFNTAVPITMQTLIILSLAMILGARCGAMATALYLLAGALGLPVFAKGAAGFSHLFGPTGGFLFSFVLAAWLVGKMAEDRWGQKFINILFTQLTGSVLILAVGFAWLGFFTGFENIMDRVYPLMPGLYIKVLLGSLLVFGANALMKHLIRNRHQWD
jgi:biotin transport system substrate-specific component